MCHDICYCLKKSVLVNFLKLVDYFVSNAQKTDHRLPQLHNSNQISQSDFKNINWNDPKGSPVSHDVYPVFP